MNINSIANMVEDMSIYMMYLAFGAWLGVQSSWSALLLWKIIFVCMGVSFVMSGITAYYGSEQ